MGSDRLRRACSWCRNICGNVLRIWRIVAGRAKTYHGFCWSEGHHQWLYAGLATGNYGNYETKPTNLKLWKYPYLPHFDLLKIHPLEVDVGMPWTDKFHHGNEGWGKPDRIEQSIDEFLAATIAYGHIGWLVEERYGIRRMCRSYYMLQQLQSRYVMRAPEEILYGARDWPDQQLPSAAGRQLAREPTVRPLSRWASPLGQRQCSAELVG